MENKVRFKLHKVKKNWVTIGVTTLSMVALAGGSLLAQGKVEADETSAPNGDGLQQLSEDGTASLVTTTTVTEQASAQASVAAVATASVSHETSSQATTSAVAQEATAQAQSSQVIDQEVAVSSQTQASAQETLTTEQVSQGQATTQATVQERSQSDTPSNQVGQSESSVTPSHKATRSGGRRVATSHATAKANSQNQKKTEVQTSQRIETESGQTSAQSTPSVTEQARPRVLTNAAPSIATRAADSTIRINANRNTNITITASGTTPNVTIITGPNTPKPNVTVTSPNGTRPNVTIVTQPNQPNKPVQPSQPSQPSQPNKPVQPSQPSLDYKPVASNLKTIDGKQYYVENGVVKKNAAIELDGRLYYFDETGAMVDQSKPLYRADAIPNNSINAVYNQAYDTSSKSFEHLDNFLTADSWYRPKQILKDGKNWTPSTEKDYRPLLMTWWPDKVTQVNYLNYMSQQGFSDKTYTTDMMSYDLASAADLIQVKIEERIGREGNTTWLRQLMSDFIKTQPGWNSESEDNLLVGKDHLQGGALTFLNNSTTSHANSDFRLMNRTPTNQTGTRKYHIDHSNGGYELLLANDIDNSNPAVQAEQLNWLHYIMNIGSILGNDPSANFDGVRIDAVDNVDADLLQIASDYFKEKYRVADNEANAIAHLSILEAWSYNDHQYNKDTKGAQLSIDNPLRETLLTTFLRKSNYRGSLERVITNSLNNRSSEQKHTPRDANYIFVRAHDSEVQAVLANIISKQINPKTDGFTFTMDELKQAFEIYNADMRKADKKYTQYNIPAAYATMLTNKDSITRVYYGDLFTDDGQYMAEKSPYYNAIDALLRARIKYVAGGQDMKVTKHNGYEIMSSVRYGKGAEEVNQLGTAETRNQGMLVLTANRPDMKLGANDRLVVNMGSAHKNQAYRPLLLSKSTGLATYFKDSDVPAGLVRYTDNQGNLTFTADDITGHSTVEVSGYLAVWVPVGASENQDARTKASTTKKGEQVFESSAALDSQVIYEGFSNFQDFVKTPSQYTNHVIAQNAKLFKEWGITSFEFAPQYVSSQDGTFLDSIIENGYAFEDRYDIAMSKNNKYGSLKDLMDALRALHAEGISAIADWVPDQIYNLPGKEVVTASRTNSYGTPRPNAEIYNSLYAAKTRTFGNDFQGKYGGAFLDELKAKYPAIFERVQISNGRKLTTNEKITQWSAKYFNGSNIQGTGARYVLQDNATNQYFSLKAGQTFLPKQMTEITATGFRRVGDKVQYFSTSGYLAKNTFIQVGANQWYYFDKNGNMVTGEQVIDGKKYFFLDNGLQLRHVLRQGSDGHVYYYDPKGVQAFNGFYDFAGPRQDVRYFDGNGQMYRGLHDMYGTTFYFDEKTGIQAKDKFIRFADGRTRYFIPDTGNLAVNRFAQNPENKAWYYLDSNGYAVTGLQTINGKQYYFDNEGRQVKGHFVTINNQRYFLDGDSGEIARSRFVTENNKWYYVDGNGKLVKGAQVINGNHYYFNNDYSQVKGAWANGRYYDGDSGQAVTNRFVQVGANKWAYLNQNGQKVVGLQHINGKLYYFEGNGVQAKGKLLTYRGKKYYFDANSGEAVTNRFIQVSRGVWYCFNASGQAVTGEQVINGQHLYFDASGRQVKGRYVWVKGQRRYYDANTGAWVRKR